MRRAADLALGTAPLTCGHFGADLFNFRRHLLVCKTCGEANITLRHAFRVMARRVPRSIYHAYHGELMTSDPFDYESLDPGIRDLVRLLRHSHFDTTDSGDGVSKPAEHRVLHFPHVFCRTDPRSLIGECDRMREVLVEAGLFVSDHNLEVETVETPDGLRVVPSRPVKGFRVEGSYNPDDMSAVIAVLGEPQQGDP